MSDATVQQTPHTARVIRGADRVTWGTADFATLTEHNRGTVRSRKKWEVSHGIIAVALFVGLIVLVLVSAPIPVVQTLLFSPKHNAIGVFLTEIMRHFRNGICDPNRQPHNPPGRRLASEAGPCAPNSAKTDGTVCFGIFASKSHN